MITLTHVRNVPRICILLNITGTVSSFNSVKWLWITWLDHAHHYQTCQFTLTMPQNRAKGASGFISIPQFVENLNINEGKSSIRHWKVARGCGSSFFWRWFFWQRYSVKLQVARSCSWVAMWAVKLSSIFYWCLNPFLCVAIPCAGTLSNMTPLHVPLSQTPSLKVPLSQVWFGVCFASPRTNTFVSCYVKCSVN